MQRWNIAVLVLAGFSGKAALSFTAQEIADKAFGLAQPKTAHSEQLMKVFKDKDVAEKEFTMDMKKGSAHESKVLINFTKPNKIKFLMHSHPGAEDDQWLKMSSGQIKRISSSSKGSSFVNSHFSYEDFSSKEKENYKFDLLGEDKATGADCYKLNTVRVKGKDSYDKVVLYVRKTDFFVVKSDFYQKGKLFKSLENIDVKSIKGILTPYKMVMKMTDGGERTELELKNIDYNANLKDSLFVKESL